mmetsp:Transcript_12930/g.26293  ORF Transcript_12930/g.26293 Transcript_12930/m.26293 type:complete len:220 (-) Transcript_12930:14-673(-)
MISRARRSPAPTGPPRLLLSILFKKITIFSFLQSQYLSTIYALPNIMDMIKKSSITLEECTADIISSSNTSLKIKCKILTTGEFLPQAEIRKGDCKDFRSESKYGDVHNKGGNEESDDDSAITATKIVTTTFQDEDSMMIPAEIAASGEGDDDSGRDNTGPFLRSYCVRCDLFYGPTDDQRISLVAKWFDIIVSYNGIENGECFGAREEECSAGEDLKQ